MKIKCLFVVVLLFVNFTLIESLRGVRHRTTQHLVVRRHYLNKPRLKSRQYFTAGNGDAENTNKWVEPLPPISPDHPSMQQAKRLNYLASNKKGARSNIGRVLSGGQQLHFSMELFRSSYVICDWCSLHSASLSV